MSEPIATTITFMDGPLALRRKVLTIHREEGYVVQVGHLRDGEPIRYWEQSNPVAQAALILQYRLHCFQTNTDRASGREYWLGFQL